MTLGLAILAFGSAWIAGESLADYMCAKQSLEITRELSN